ncbi:MAG: DegV family protein [Firmicutes bacterium]|nr:DegV family protein [Bacillota bacterium]MDY3659087.1 DegV family protein [Eubacteriales bacterium]
MEENFCLSTDTCCDELKSTLKKNKINFIKMCYISDGEIYEDNFDTIEEYKYFYDEMKKGKMFSTTGLNPYQVKEYFLDILEKNKKDILHISLSSGLSGTYGITKGVADEINQTSKYKIYVLDSLCATQAQNAMLCYATLLRNQGKTAKEAMKVLEEATKKLIVEFFLSDLETLKRGGRISGAQAVMAKVMQLRPILHFDPEGKLQVIEKVMGSKKAIKCIFDNFLKCYDPNSPIPIFIPYSGDFTNAEEVKKMIEEKLGITNVIIGPVGPVVGSHTGPSLCGLIYLSKTNRT